MVNAIDVSNYAIQYLKKKGQSVNHLKLQKLLYYIEAWHMVFLEQPIFADPIEAWQHGPVIRSVWNYFKKHSILYDELPEPKKDLCCDLSDEQRDVINDVLDEYGDKTGYYLENLTHAEEPWRRAWENGEKTISKDFMKQYYGERIYGRKTKNSQEPVSA